MADADSQRPQTSSTWASIGSNFSSGIGNVPQSWLALKEEATVNNALIIFLQGIASFNMGGQGQWLIYRQPFDVRDGDGNPVFRACVDGIYEVTRDVNIVVDGVVDTIVDKLTEAIVEVKPIKRDQDSANRIAMQECAQLSAWISQTPPEQKVPIYLDHDYRRVLISQDRDELYVTVATFSEKYINYIRDRTTDREQRADRKDDTGFLRVQCQGPYHLSNPRHMEEFGKQMTSFCQQGRIR
ncbi:hypothetical protein NLG97_g9168 [Lecanicillium saksenae]|uniref:Uncharacterized protein n=1 Tax=Lecanicillium saksenae TaxID=468837 RepID=A0ACC1QGS0_9HYPO|nr:hypothetical protein NLG97_g9168 [Lecanicillium saksenae]